MTHFCYIITSSLCYVSISIVSREYVCFLFDSLAFNVHILDSLQSRNRDCEIYTLRINAICDIIMWTALYIQTDFMPGIQGLIVDNRNVCF